MRSGALAGIPVGDDEREELGEEEEALDAVEAERVGEGVRGPRKKVPSRMDFSRGSRVVAMLSVSVSVKAGRCYCWC